MFRDYFYCFDDKTEPDVGACNTEADCSNNGNCVNNYCECKPGFDDPSNPKDCSSKLSLAMTFWIS